MREPRNNFILQLMSSYLVQSHCYRDMHGMNAYINVCTFIKYILKAEVHALSSQTGQSYLQPTSMSEPHGTHHLLPACNAPVKVVLPSHFYR